MKSELDLSAVHIPYGVLHDQKLLQVSKEKDKYVFLFSVELCEEDYTPSVFEKYKDYNRCKMTIHLPENSFHTFMLSSSVSKRGVIKSLDLDETTAFDILSNASEATFVSMQVRNKGVSLELHTSFFDAKYKYKKYSRYFCLTMESDANNVQWDWYSEQQKEGL